MMNKAQSFQKDIVKKYRKEIWSPFIRALKDYRMIEDGDKVAVAISGGKDSFLLAKLLQELTRHPLVDFEVVFISMDPGYAPYNKEKLKATAAALDIDLHIESHDIFEVVSEKAPEYPCFLCARMRRGILYGMAERLGCNKLALGHHFDDVVETILLNLFYAGSFKSMMPKVTSDNYEKLELIRPLYYVREKDIRRIMGRNSIDTLDCGCTVAAGETASKRAEMKALVRELKKTNPDIDKSIFKAPQNVNLDHVIGWEKDGGTFRFDD